jgi:hypothetical protein
LRLIRFASRDLQLDYLSVYASRSTPPLCTRESVCALSPPGERGKRCSRDPENRQRGPAWTLSPRLQSVLSNKGSSALAALSGSVAHGALGLVHFAATARVSQHSLSVRFCALPKGTLVAEILCKSLLYIPYFVKKLYIHYIFQLQQDNLNLWAPTRK